MYVTSLVRVVGPLARYVPGFDSELARQGFTENSAEGQLRLAAHLSRWLAERGLDETALTVERAEEFTAARRAVGCTNYLTVKALMPLFTYLHDLGVVPVPPVPVPVGAVETLLERYRHYLKTERGLTDGTIRGYVDAVRPFLVGRADRDGLDLEQVTAGHVTAFMLDVCRRRSPKTAQLTTSALRSLLGYLQLVGLVGPGLSAAVPTVAHRKLVGIPRDLAPEQVAAMLACCDRSRPVGSS